MVLRLPAARCWQTGWKSGKILDLLDRTAYLLDDPAHFVFPRFCRWTFRDEEEISAATAKIMLLMRLPEKQGSLA
jgi:hypothetical protein